MKARLEETGLAPGSKMLHCFEVDLPHFELFWHHHPEYELTYIAKGDGQRLVGDSMRPFTEGDLVLLGPHLPHSWISGPASKEPVKALVLHISPACLQWLTEFPGADSLQQLLQHSKQGIVFQEATNRAAWFMQALTRKQGLAQLSTLAQLMETLTERRYETLASALYRPPNRNTHAASRLNKTLQFLHEEFATSRANIATLAGLTHMSESAFCKFFKRHTGKTFSNYVNELRVAHACQLLAETDETIEQTAYASGFESLSYFNRVFLQIKGMQPSRYRSGHRAPTQRHGISGDLTAKPQ